MVFTSVIYFLFFTGVYTIYWLIPSNKSRKNFLFIASLFFYGTWSLLYLFHFIFVLFLNYIFYLYFTSNDRNKYILVSIIFFNILNLIFYKYIYFILNIVSSFRTDKIEVENLFGFHPILPLAISFYTFQIISFFIDEYKSKSPKIASGDFFLFFSFFPQLVAGPILRSEDLLIQFDSIREKKIEYLLRGIFLILLGTTKKILIADNIAMLINPIWRDPFSSGSMEIFLAANGFCMQVYCDFSGYSDLAIGSALLLGYEIPKNFNAPYYSRRFSELWKNWHISLSNWLRDYIYIPLGGNRYNSTLLITFTLGGLWHGAAYSYILWGFFCGLILIIEKYIYYMLPEINSFLIRGIQILITYLLFTFAILFFRSENLESIPELIKGFLFLKTTGTINSLTPLLYLIPLSFGIQVFDRIHPNSITSNKNIIVYLSLYTGILLLLIGSFGGASKEFIYFQF